jgi:hypothetical protein
VEIASNLDDAGLELVDTRPDALSHAMGTLARRRETREIRHVSARVRPLLVRPGARFACAGDGLCCTDIHVLGPVSRTEARRLRVIDDTVVARSEALEVAMLRVGEGGHCTFHVVKSESGHGHGHGHGHGQVETAESGGAHVSQRICAIHAATGADAQPASCRRFPYRLVATPLGGRITTEHRCPCRTMGDRPPVRAESALPSLVDGQGHLSVDARVEATVLLGKGKRIAFARYVELERVMLERLAAGHDPLEVLGYEPFPPLHDLTWSDVGHLFRQRPDGSACGEALAWMGDELLRSQGTSIRPLRARPWNWAFEHAEARTPAPENPEAMLADFVADALWSLDWHGRAPFDVGRAELATRVVLARGLASRFVAAGTRPDRAMAEAIMSVELGGASALWGEIMKRVRLSPGGPAPKQGRR